MTSSAVVHGVAAALLVCLLVATPAADNDTVRCLKGVKHSLHDPNGYLDWDFGANRSICSFNGVSCGSEGRGMALNLPSMSLYGKISFYALEFCASVITGLDLSSNFITGDISYTLCDWIPLVVTLNLANNQIAGSIPRELSNCQYLDTLILSHNHLSGQIPPLLHLRHLELSENYLSGAILQLLSSFEASVFSGNAALCGHPLPPCVGEILDSSLSKASLAIIVAAGIFSATASLLLSYAGCRWYRNRSMAAPTIPLVADHQRVQDWVEHPGDLAFLKGECVLEVIGRGGCGEVYRAQVAGMTIAIKKIVKTGPNKEESQLLDQWTRQARSEIITVGRIRHRNLLPLLAHLPRPDCNYLVYEFMNNGSLQDAIVTNNGPQLDWLARYRIAVGIATGLEYMHHHHKPHIIHRDLKPANILLDKDLEARISDFGLAKEFPDTQTQMSMSKVAGTIGYIAPEYYHTLKFTPKCDVYSLGVILAVLVTGKLPSDNFFQNTEEMSIVKWLWNVMGSGDMNPVMVIDERILGQEFKEEMMLVLRIACFCTADDPNDRPTAKDVRCMLSQIHRLPQPPVADG